MTISIFLAKIHMKINLLLLHKTRVQATLLEMFVTTIRVQNQTGIGWEDIKT
jgi:hypothetical protein